MNPLLPDAFDVAVTLVAALASVGTIAAVGAGVWLLVVSVSRPATSPAARRRTPC